MHHRNCEQTSAQPPKKIGLFARPQSVLTNPRGIVFIAAAAKIQHSVARTLGTTAWFNVHVHEERLMSSTSHWSCIQGDADLLFHYQVRMIFLSFLSRPIAHKLCSFVNECGPTTTRPLSSLARPHVSRPKGKELAAHRFLSVGAPTCVALKLSRKLATVREG